MQLARPRLFPHLSSGIGLVPILLAIFAFNLGSAAWSAVVAGRLTQDGAGTALLGALFAICEISRLPAALLLPAITLNYGARRVTQGGLLILLVLPLIALSGLGNGQVMLIFVMSALPAMAVYVGMPALVLGASKAGRDGWSLAWLGLASAADAGRAALVPSELLNHGQPLAEAGMLLTAGCAVAGLGFLVFGRMADRQSARRVMGAGVAVLVVGSFAS